MKTPITKTVFIIEIIFISKKKKNLTCFSLFKVTDDNLKLFLNNEENLKFLHNFFIFEKIIHFFIHLIMNTY